MRALISARAALLPILALGLTLPQATGLADDLLPPPGFAALSAEAPSAGAAPLSLGAQAAMLPVAGGRYPIGRQDGPSAEGPAHEMTLAPFAIDRTEVTNGAFAEFLNALAPLRGLPDFGIAGAGDAGLSAEAAGLLVEGGQGSGAYPLIALDDDQARIEARDGRLRAAPGFETHPVTETTWAGARAYCVWRGARLPSEAEWEAAARGAEGRLYPWGDAAPDPLRVHMSGRTGETVPVGSYPEGASALGALDMSGSLAEWTSSLRRPYPYVAADGREAPGAAGERVTRGGDYRFDRGAGQLTATHRTGFSNAPHRGHRHIGFRCAADGV